MNRLSILDKTEYFPLNSITLSLSVVMKSKDFQNLVLSKYQNGDGSTKTLTVSLVFEQLNGRVAQSCKNNWLYQSIKSTESSGNYSNKGSHSKDQTLTRTTKACLITKNSSSVGYF